jgi:hypothetical protein
LQHGKKLSIVAKTTGHVKTTKDCHGYWKEAIPHEQTL